MNDSSPSLDLICTQSADTVHKIMALFSGLVLVVSVLGNSISITVILTSRKLRGKVSYLLIGSLAMADLCVSLFVTTLKVSCTVTHQCASIQWFWFHDSNCSLKWLNRISYKTYCSIIRILFIFTINIIQHKVISCRLNSRLNSLTPGGHVQMEWEFLPQLHCMCVSQFDRLSLPHRFNHTPSLHLLGPLVCDHQTIQLCRCSHSVQSSTCNCSCMVLRPHLDLLR